MKAELWLPPQASAWPGFSGLGLGILGHLLDKENLWLCFKQQIKFLSSESCEVFLACQEATGMRPVAC